MPAAIRVDVDLAHWGPTELSLDELTKRVREAVQQAVDEYTEWRPEAVHVREGLGPSWSKHEGDVDCPLRRREKEKEARGELPAFSVSELMRGDDRDSALEPTHAYADGARHVLLFYAFD